MIRINQQEGSANLAELRLVLEPEIAGLAATRLHDPGGYVEADLDFHLALAEAAGNPLDPFAVGFVCRSFARAAQSHFRCGGRSGAGLVPSQMHT